MVCWRPVLLPGGTNAVVDISKLRDYVLNPDHPRGKHKARVFARALRLGTLDAEFLQKELLHAALSPAAVLREQDEYGQRYTLDFEIANAGERAIVRSGWIVLIGESAPRLTTCFVLSSQGL